MKGEAKSCDWLNISELELAAQKRLPKLAYDYYAGGADDELTVGDNIQAYKRLRLRPRMCVDVSQRRMNTTVLAQPIKIPIMIAPTAFHGMACEQGEVATVKAAGRAGTIMVLSTLSNRSIEEVLGAAKGNVWFQLYVYKDKRITEELVRRAESACAKAIVLTVDSPALGRRERDIRNGFALPQGLKINNFLQSELEKLSAGPGENGLAAYIHSLYQPAITWEDVDWLKSVTKLPIVIKGILRGDDARKAVERGASAIVVSNHGGRQLDSAISTVDALPEIVNSVRGDAEVYVDGGIRRGTDVLKALALGARAVLLGRPILWGLSVDGEDGATAVLEGITSELDLAMCLSGCPTIADITPDLVAR